MEFALFNDMGGVRATAETALQLHDQILCTDKKLAQNGLFVVRSGRKISDAEFRRLCAAEQSAN